MLLPTLSSIEIAKYFNFDPRSTGVFSRDNLPRIKDGVYVIDLDDKQSKGTHWVSLFNDRNTVAYFDSLKVEYIPQEVLSKIKYESITHREYSLMILLCVDFFFIAFIEHTIGGKTLLDHNNIFSPNDYQKNDKIIQDNKYLKDK